MTYMSTMGVKMFRLFVLIGFLESFECDTRVTVTDSECGRTYSPADGKLYLFYHGDTLNGCTLYIKTNDISKKVCAHLERMDIGSCSTTIQFYNYQYSKSRRRTERRDLQTFTCTSERMAELCQSLVTELHIDFKHDGQKTSDEVKIRITYEEDNKYIPVYNHSLRSRRRVVCRRISCLCCTYGSQEEKRGKKIAQNRTLSWCFHDVFLNVTRASDMFIDHACYTVEKDRQQGARLK